MSSKTNLIYGQHVTENVALRIQICLKGKHVNWENNTMNVKLTAQVRSNSVARAIDFANFDLKLPQFTHSEVTSKFIRMFDRMFNLCNSSNPMAKGMKSPISLRNRQSKSDFIEETTNYIKNLKEIKGKSLCHSRSKTGFVGSVTPIVNI